MTWDEKRASALVGKTVVLRLVLVADDAEEGAVPPRMEQRGTIVSADDGGFTAKTKEGAEFTIPPELDAMAPVANPGPGEADFVSLWTVVGHGTGNEAWTPGDSTPPARPPRRGARAG
ncbi:MAG: hypothetical protein JWM27_2228, partial [Gemmatimonadetes bacterium]|nr:hypothetical protein [Gemmatimonadota bacterium]